MGDKEQNYYFKLISSMNVMQQSGDKGKSLEKKKQLQVAHGVVPINSNRSHGPIFVSICSCQKILRKENSVLIKFISNNSSTNEIASKPNLVQSHSSKTLVCLLIQTHLVFELIWVSQIQIPINAQFKKNFFFLLDMI